MRLLCASTYTRAVDEARYLAHKAVGAKRYNRAQKCPVDKIADRPDQKVIGSHEVLLCYPVQEPHKRSVEPLDKSAESTPPSVHRRLVKPKHKHCNKQEHETAHRA